MQTALILMSILGCDDTATQCHHIEVLEQRWATLQACDADSEKQLSTYSSINYPVVVAVCQTPEDSGLNEIAGEIAAPENGAEDIDPPALSDPAATVDGGSGAVAAASSGIASDETSGALIPPANIPEPPADLASGNAESVEPTTVEEVDREGIARRVLDLVKDVLPESENLKTLVSEPVHVVTESYSWVARRFETQPDQ